MHKTPSPYKSTSQSPTRVAFSSSINSKKKTVHQHWQDPKTYVTKEISQQDVIQLKSIFDELSSTQCGYLIPADLCVALRRFGFNATHEIIYDIIVEIDQIEKGGISFNEFMSILQRKPSVKDSREDITWAFKKYDRYIDVEDFRRVARELEQDLTEEQIVAIMESCGTGGRMKYEEFQKVMTADLW